MSIETAMSRVAELSGTLPAGAPAGPARPATGPAPAPGLSSDAFARRLAAATTSTTAPGASVAGAAIAGATGAPSAPAGGPTRFDAEIDAAAERHRVDPALLKALIGQESGFNPKAVSPAGARGLTQLMPGTAAGLGVRDPFDPAQAIDGGARYLRQQLDRFGGDEAKALAAYNAGPGAVQRHGGVPPYAETQIYVRRVMSMADSYRRSTATSTGGAPTTGVGV